VKFKKNENIYLLPSFDSPEFYNINRLSVFILKKMNIQYNNSSHVSKSDLIEKMADELSLSRNKVKQVLNVFIESVQQEVAQGKKVSLIGFGSFSAINQSERVGMNPKTGEKVNIPSKTIPKFKAGKDFRKIVNKRD